MKKLLLVCVLVLVSSTFVGASRPTVVKLLAVARNSTSVDGNKEFLVNKEGRKVSGRFEGVWTPDSRGNYLVFDGWSYYFLDKDNAPMFGYEKEKDYQFDWAESFSGDYVRVKRDGKWGILKYDGVLAWFDDFYVGLPDNSGMVAVSNEAGDQCFHRYPDGRPVYQERYRRVGNIHEQRFYAEDSNGQYWLVSIHSENRIFGPYQKAGDFDQGYAPVQVDGKWNFVERATAKYVLEKWHDQVFHISEGKAIVWDDGSGHGVWSCIDVATQKTLYSNQVIAIEKSINGVAVAEANLVKPSQPMTILIDSNTGEKISDAARSIIGPDELGCYCFKVDDYQQYLFDPATRQQVYPPLIANKPREYVMKILGFQNGYCSVIDKDGNAYHVSPKWMRPYETNFDEVSAFAKVEIKKD